MDASRILVGWLDYKTWICVKCLEVGRFTWAWGDKPKPNRCPTCTKPVYEVATFQARAAYVGAMFEYACFYLLVKRFNINARLSSEQSRLYDFEIKNNVVVEAKGSPKSVENPDGSISKLGRAGMQRSDTKKKAFANAEEWHTRFPNGHFFIITNAIPTSLQSYRSEKIDAIYDVTKESQLLRFVKEISAL
ncbi:MAG TPA: hypothetical protein VNI77_02990 [Nitrososphaera sp.]|nr:hypothetical protein [Nitrososphaera sp.]